MSDKTKQPIFKQIEELSTDLQLFVSLRKKIKNEVAIEKNEEIIKGIKSILVDNIWEI